MIKRILYIIYKKFFISKRFYRYYLFLFKIVIHGLGLLNYISFKESGEERFLNAYLGSLKNDPIIFDVGAYNGSYSLYCKKVSPNSRIYAFEPNPSSFAHFKSAVESTDIKVYECGLSDKNENAMLYDKAQFYGSQHASIFSGVLYDLHDCKDIIGVVIKLKTLDEIINEENINSIDLLKIDTEGSELIVLKGAINAISSSKIKCIQIEFNEMNVISRVFLRDFIKILPGFVFYRVFPDGMIEINYNPIECELFAFQNIVAIRKDINIKKIL